MILHSRFLKFTAICGFLTVLTTVGIHILFPSFGGDFTERIQLFNNPLYIANKFWVIIHCILVLVAMSGIFLLLFKQKPGSTLLGFIFFIGFALVEITRQMFVLFYLNPLRATYNSLTDPSSMNQIKMDIENFALIGNSFFGVFIICFSLGNLCYGIAIWDEKRNEKILSILMILWALLGFISFSNEFVQSEDLSAFIKVMNSFYQPMMRGLLAIWVWQQVKDRKQKNLV